MQSSGSGGEGDHMHSGLCPNCGGGSFWYELFPHIVFYALADRRKRLHQEILDSRPDTRVPLLSTVIPYHSEVERMGLHRAPVAEYAGKSPAATAYAALWCEVAARL